jgi:hypothetical protein
MNNGENPSTILDKGVTLEEGYSSTRLLNFEV